MQVKLLWAEEMGGEEVEVCVDFSFRNSTMETEWVTRAELGRAFWKGFVFFFYPRRYRSGASESSFRVSRTKIGEGLVRRK